MMIVRLISIVIYKPLFAAILKRQIRSANKWQQLTGYRYIIMLWNGWPRTYRKKDLEERVKRRQFGKNVKISDLERDALYITPLKKKNNEQSAQKREA